MTVFVPNTFINNTWDFWRNRTNELAAAMSNRAVTVGGNAAVGAAVIQGSLRSNTVFLDTLTGGNSSVSSNIAVTSVTTFSSNVYISSNLNISNIVTANSLNVNTVRVGANTNIVDGSITTGSYYGSFVGQTIAVQYGGTGINTLPSNGQILIGNGNSYVLSTLTSGTGINVSNSPGGITINSTGVLSFQSNTTNVRYGPVTLTAQDITQALGYVPSAPASSSWQLFSSDLYYFSGNVSVGLAIGGNTTPNRFYVNANTNNDTPIAVFNNANTGATTAGYISISSANISANVGVVFSALGSIKGGVVYNQSTSLLSLLTNGNNYVNINSAGNIGIGTISPFPIEGGQGIHIVGSSPGITLDRSGTTRWHIGQNPAFNALAAGARVFGPFGVYSDEAGCGWFFDANTTSAGFAVYTNNTKTMYISNTGIVQIGTTSTTSKLNVGGDVNADGFVNYSDYRLKTDIIPLENAIERISKLNPVSFKYKDSNKNREGFIAHEIQEVIPSAVNGVKDAFVFQTLDKTEMIAVTVKALQELINKVKVLEETVGLKK